MGDERPDKERIFSTAAEIADPGERAAYLDDACGGDRQLRDEIEDLLKHDLEAGSFLDSPAAGLDATIGQPITEKPGTLVGPYKLLEQIGEGGMGLVFMARQREPVKRNVALKVIKPGMDSKQVIGRFEAERQALALMDHPNIARVLDAGSTESGRPYFVMDLVRGIPVTEYCDRERLSTRERLELFVPICQAVQHAHQKGIIHRDIKATNILVTLHDGVPVPKVIDFGVAKATNRQLIEETLVTGFAQVIGTPLYMSPEQAEMSGLDVDTRTDVYSLGVLLYELLTGTTPFEHAQLKEAAYDEMRRIIREEEPPKPSARISTLGDSAATIAQNRHTDSRTLTQQVSGELDWIVLKTLEKDRTRRYETANDLAKDVQRHLNDEAVEACPPSAAYRLSKFARRHRTMFAAGAMVIMALVAGAAIATDQAIRATKAEGVAEERLTVADKQRRLAKQQEKLALKQKQLAEQQEKEAIRQRDAAGRSLYFAHIRLAQQDWKDGQTSRLYDLLDTHIPQPGRPDLRGWEWYYWLSLCHRDEMTLQGRTLWVSSVAWSPDGRQLASAGGDEAVKVWDARTGDHLFTLSGSRCFCVAWSPDGQRLATGNLDGRVSVWKAPKGGELLAIPAHTAPVRCVAWSPDGKRLASASEDKAVKIWDAENGREEQALEGHSSEVWGVAWSPSGKRLASASGDSTARIWDAQTGREERVLRPHPYDAFEVAWSPDGKRFATSGYPDMNAKVWDADTWELLFCFDHSGTVNTLAWSPDSRHLATGTRGHTITVWDTIRGKESFSLHGHTDGIFSVAWSPDGKQLVSGSKDGTIKIWDAREQEDVVTFGDGAIKGKVAWSPDDRWLACADKGARVIMCDSITGETTQILPQSFAPAWSPDGQRLACRNASWSTAIYEVLSGKALFTLEHPSGASSAAWSPNGRQLASQSFAGGTVMIWDAVTGKQVSTFVPEQRRLFAIAWSPESKRLATAGISGTVKIWRVSDWRKLHTLHGHRRDRYVDNLAWSRDGKRLASGGWDETIKIWDTATGREILSLTGHTAHITALTWSLDGKRVASTAGDGALKIWDTATGAEVLSLCGSGGLSGVTWSHDGQRLAAVDAGTVTIWDASLGYQHAASSAYTRERARKLYQRGIRLARSRRIRESDEAFRRARELDPEFTAAYLRRGAAHRETGNLAQAIADYNEAIRLNPKNALAHNNLARLLATCSDSRVRDADRAAELASKAVDLSPREGAFWNTLGVAQYRAGNWKAAVEALQKSSELKFYRVARTEFFTAMAHWQLGNKQQSRRAYDKAVEWMQQNKPEDEELRRFRAEAAELLGIEE